MKFVMSLMIIFCSVGTNLINSLPAASQCFTAFLDSSVRDSIVVDNVDVNELLFLIDSLKCGKSCGFDGISPLVGFEM